MVEEFRFYYGTNFPVPLCAYESKAPPKSSKAKFKTKGVTWRPGEVHIPHSPRASPPVSISIQRFIVKVNFWLILLFFLRKCHMLTAPLQRFLSEGSCSALWERVTAIPWHGGKKEVGRCDTPGGSSQQNKTWLDGKLTSSFGGKETEAARPWARPAI